MSIFGTIGFITSGDESYNQELRERAKRIMMEKKERREREEYEEMQRRKKVMEYYYFNHQQVRSQRKHNPKLIGYDLWNRPIYK